jgi:hypothetical protein
MLERLLDITLENDEDIEEARLQTLSREDLIEELKRAKVNSL